MLHPAHSTDRRAQGGFSLLEVLVAMSILAIAIMSLTGMRSNSLVDASEARSERVAREIATKVLGEIEAGVIRAYEMRNVRHQVEEMPDFEWKIVIGESEIQEAESEILELAADESGSDSDQKAYERQQWLNRRSEVRRARDQGRPVDDLETEDLEVDESPDEDTIEEVAVFVYWTKLNGKTADAEGHFSLRGQVTSLALSGLTPEQAEARGDDSSGGSSSGEGSR